jgi:hypothetical protein
MGKLFVMEMRKAHRFFAEDNFGDLGIQGK